MKWCLSRGDRAPQSRRAYFARGAGVVFGLWTSFASAQSFSINRSSIDGGGGDASGFHTPTGVTFVLRSTIGQHDAGPASGPMVGTTGAMTFSLSGGFQHPPLRIGPPPCVADVDDGSSTGTPDGGVTIDDLLYYLVVFEVGDLQADVDDGSSTGVRDGGVTIDDLLYFLTRFESGC